QDAIGKLCGARFSLGVASQTDRGVHALANVAQVDILRSINKKKKPPAAGDEKAPPFLEFELQNGLNYHLKEHPIVVTRVDLVDQEWDARSSAVGRSYLYRLVTGGDTRTSLGTHDFSCFGKNGDTYTKVPMRTIDLADVVEVPASAYANPSDQYRFYHVSIKSRAFMYHQGEWNEADIRRMLEVDPQRTPFPPANLLAPAHGLFLRGVDYGGADTAVARQYVRTSDS
ncbi:tRNA pseudouridine synthase, partial [Acanthamoeba castellanii str. Neff]